VSADRELVRRGLSGDSAALRAIVELYEFDVFSLCVKILRHRHDAEDVVQEVFLRVFRSLPQWDSTRPLKPWILGIAVNRCRTWLAKRKRIPEPMEFLADQPDRPTGADEDGGELRCAIRKAVDGLRSDYREVFILFHETGQSYEEIAEVIGRPVGTIKTWLHRARAIILEALNQRGLANPNPESPRPS
jgi:RNA polymerase sigma-70 factor (ECF subfamily)